jgi:hypothetical protein
MIGMNSTLTPPPPPTTHADFRAFLDLLALVANPDATKVRIEQLTAASDEAHSAIAEAKAAHVVLDNRKAAHQGELDKAMEEHTRRITRERAQFDEECDRRKRELVQREAAVKVREDQVAVAIAATATLRGDLENRIAKIRAATA